MMREEGKGGFFRSRANIALLAFVAIAGFFVIAEHRAHAIQWLPLVLLAACPLLHLFHGHGGHGGYAEHGERGEGEARRKP